MTDTVTNAQYAVWIHEAPSPASLPFRLDSLTPEQLEWVLACRYVNNSLDKTIVNTSAYYDTTRNPHPALCITRVGNQIRTRPYFTFTPPRTPCYLRPYNIELFFNLMKLQVPFEDIKTALVAQHVEHVRQSRT